ncbi:hypothetical protein [Flavobacterium hungaricum]|uniref:DUF5658 domain-containing protein n=1 Tax=Flavobacterium hungaricum TaxID=2082725 RepID=A0ABR9TRU7_9FLAO|nr:hypothetical protein [Flavobacterium hungaricum]MBE8728096.1 hypothetical protein [Flavobacterium hungaricum]
MKEKVLNSKIILLIPAYWACLFDEIITIVFQSEQYWKGDLSKADEGNPIGAFFMAQHIYGLFVLCILWLLIIGAAASKLSGRKLKIFVLFVLIAHSFGASSWISNHFGFWYAIIFMFINAVLFIECQNIYERRNDFKTIE